MDKICNFFKKIFIICLIYRIRFIWKKIDKYNNCLRTLVSKEKKYKKLFIKDEEDLILNKNFLDTFKIKKDKCRNKLYKREVQLKIYLYKYEFLSEDFIIKCNNLNISSNLVLQFRDIELYIIHSRYGLNRIK